MNKDDEYSYGSCLGDASFYVEADKYIELGEASHKRR